MRVKAYLILLLAIAVAGLVGLEACGSGGSSSAATVTLLTLAPSSITVSPNTTSSVSATPTLSNNTIATTTVITWIVNGVGGGNLTFGTIAPSTTNQLVGIYTAPAVVPDTNIVITATTPQDPSNTTDTTLVTSNAVTVSFSGALGLVVSPSGQSVPAGSSFQFSATLNNLPDPNATWTVTPNSPPNGADIGSIGFNNGLYQAPLAPPPGQTVTITAKDGGVTATAVATVVFSDASLQGPFAFGYAGGTGANFISVAGSFVADGQGTIIGGVEDIQNFSTGISIQVPIQSGNYLVGPDGRTRMSLNNGGQAGSNLQFALTSTQHALMIRFDQNNVASGTIDQQNLDALTNSNSVIQGPYVIGVAGEDVSQNTMGVAGKFTASGTNPGMILSPNSTFDINDGGTVTTPTSVPTSSVSVSGAYGFDPAFPGTGRGTISLNLTTHSSISNSDSNQQLQFAFYAVDGTHLHVVEIDNKSLLAGEIYSTPAGPALAPANFAFASSGSSSMGAYAAGGVFTSDGGGHITGGEFDSNSAGTPGANPTIVACPYTVAATGRIDLQLFTGTAPCPNAPNANTSEFALYQTTQGSNLMLEIDANAISSGVAFQQAASPAAVAGSFGLVIAGQGTAANIAGAIPQDVVGQVTLSGASIITGTLDINNFNAVFRQDPISSTSTVVAPDPNGRGTATLNATNPTAALNLIYYIIDGNRALLLDQDKTRVGTGAIARQF
jgi:hypothetical protein